MAVVQKPSVAEAKPRKLSQVQGHPKLHSKTLAKKTTEKKRNTDLPLRFNFRFSRAGPISGSLV